MTRPPHIAIVGTGMIGQSWAIVFARAGRHVRLFDHMDGAAADALPAIGRTLEMLSRRDLLAGQAPDRISKRLTVCDDLVTALDGADYVQENTPEVIDIKRRIFTELNEMADSEAVLASSTSALLPSQFAQGLSGKHRCLVVHPLNPPHLIPAVEIVPSADTDPGVISRARDLMRDVGQDPVVLRTEVPGFVMNRLQGALLDEAFALVRDGIATIEDIDTAMRNGLARRWSVTGPFETIDLNAPGGVAGFFDRYAQAYAEIGIDRPKRPKWSGAFAADITAQCRARRALGTLPDRQAWRDERLADLAAHFLIRSDNKD